MNYRMCMCICPSSCCYHCSSASAAVAVASPSPSQSVSTSFSINELPVGMSCPSSCPVLASHLQPLARINYFYYLSGVFAHLPKHAPTIPHPTPYCPSPSLLISPLSFCHFVFRYILIAYRAITICTLRQQIEDIY